MLELFGFGDQISCCYYLQCILCVVVICILLKVCPCMASTSMMLRYNYSMVFQLLVHFI